jgi:AGZA family xanthine/uracil permease-like MFS transporter
MGATWWYTLLTGLLIGVCSVVGLLSLFISLIPRAVIAPIFIFIGFEIIRQAYKDSPPAHSPAVSLSFLPVVASLMLIILGQFMGTLNATPDKLPVRLQIMHQTLTMLSNGFILTGLLWGSMLAYLIDNKARLAALYCAVCAVLTLFGFIHSVMPSGELYLPWHVISTHAHYMLAVAYLALSGILLLLRGKTDTVY